MVKSAKTPEEKLIVKSLLLDAARPDPAPTSQTNTDPAKLLWRAVATPQERRSNAT